MTNLFLKSCLFFFCISISTLLRANDTAFGGSGATPFPINQPDIKFLAESIVIEGKDLNKEDSGSWHYQCDFLFKNTLDKTLSVRMGFPFPVYSQEEAVATPVGRHVKIGEPLVYDFSVTINNQPVESKRQSISSLPDKKMFYNNAYLWDAKFFPFQTVKIHHDYITGATFDVMGYHWLSYVLKTGALWQGGLIGKTLITIHPNTPTRLCNELDHKADYLRPAPKGILILGNGKVRSYQWKLKDFHPTTDLSLCLQTGRNYVRYQIIFPLLQLREPFIHLTTLNPKQLRLLKNTIYAQYGRTFNSSDLQEYFNQQWWYEPNPNYSESMLTKEDKDALAAISRAEPQ